MFNEKLSKMAWRCIFCVAAIVVTFAAIIASALVGGGIAAIVVAGDLYYSIYKFRHMEHQSLVEYAKQSLVAAAAVAVVWFVFPAAAVISLVIAIISRIVSFPTLIIGSEEDDSFKVATTATTHAPSYMINEVGNIVLADATETDILGAETSTTAPSMESVMEKLEQHIKDNAPEVQITTTVEDEVIEITETDTSIESETMTGPDSMENMLPVVAVVDVVVSSSEVQDAIKEADPEISLESTEKQE